MQIEFQSRLAAIKRAMEREEWAWAIDAVEQIGPIPEKAIGIVSNILFYLYVSRNQHEKLSRLSGNFVPGQPKDCVAALLLLRDRHLGYGVQLPAIDKINLWEDAVENHACQGRLELMDLQLCLVFLSALNRPRSLALLHALATEAGGILDNESIEIVLRCYLRNGWFEQARRFLRSNNLNDIAFDRFDFLIDRAANPSTPVPKSNDKFLTFLHDRFGAGTPVKLR